MSVAIRAESLSKSYLITHEQHEPYVALRDVLTNGARRMWRNIRHPLGGFSPGDPSREVFWALRDIDFEIEQGDRVGIIGRNGAGKSTLLKVLSRITEPTTGRLSMNGRVASLLEVGTGFHPELTGRENIFLNGAVLGMSRAEIKRKFDEIVAFAEVERFLDTPVKRYSSGMYVRLAFAVAAHLEPEILVVDEVLAVGDAAFQKKCLGKMKEVGQEGRTVLFVSHNMNAIEQLCESAILLEGGKISQHSKNVRQVVRAYLQNSRESGSATSWVNSGSEFENAWFKPLRVLLTDEDGGEARMPVSNDAETWVHIEAEIAARDPSLTIGYAIYTETNELLYWSYLTDVEESRWPELPLGRCILRSQIPQRFLNEGVYRIDLLGGLHFRSWLFPPESNGPAVYLSIQGGLSDSPYWMMKRPGPLAPVIAWDVAPVLEWNTVA
jgi:lipopolysaccharide transport system ATP-binding protein